jgi:hypothetical protein
MRADPDPRSADARVRVAVDDCDEDERAGRLLRRERARRSRPLGGVLRPAAAGYEQDDA